MRALPGVVATPRLPDIPVLLLLSVGRGGLLLVFRREGGVLFGAEDTLACQKREEHLKKRSS